jgi:hypothetical protein
LDVSVTITGNVSRVPGTAFPWPIRRDIVAPHDPFHEHGGFPVANELPRLRDAHPLWRIWSSAQGRLYATRPGMSVLLPGASVTVDAMTADALRQAIGRAEKDAERDAAHREWRSSYGR